jgi:hypothetical protein
MSAYTAMTYARVPINDIALIIGLLVALSMAALAAARIGARMRG